MSSRECDTCGHIILDDADGERLPPQAGGFLICIDCQGELLAYLFRHYYLDIGETIERWVNTVERVREEQIE